MSAKISVLMIIIATIGFFLVLFGSHINIGFKLLGYIMIIIPVLIACVFIKSLEAKKEMDKEHALKSMSDNTINENRIVQARAISKKYIGVRDFVDMEGNVMHGDAFEIEFEYEFSRPQLNFSTKFKAKTCVPINDIDAAVCMWMAGKDMLIDIEVYKSYCMIKTDLSQYYNEDIYLIDEDDVPKVVENTITTTGSETTIDYEKKNESIIYIIYGVIILVAAFFPVSSMARSGRLFARDIVILFIIVFISFLFIRSGFKVNNNRVIKALGIDQETTEFKCYVDVSFFRRFRNGYVYIVEFTYVGLDGVKRVAIDRFDNALVYDRLRHMDVIPIKVYRNKAVLNADRIQR